MSGQRSTPLASLAHSVLSAFAKDRPNNRKQIGYGETSCSGCSIRRAFEADLHSAFELVKEYFQTIDVWVRDSETEFSDYALGDDRGVWLAFAGTEPVGCIVLHPLTSSPGCGEIKRLYVKPAYRRKGLAEGLLLALEQFAARTAGYEWLYLDSKDDLVTAIRFYERNGYERCDRYNSNPQATVFMRKRFAR